MKFTITETFCEILSGLAALGVVIGGLDWRGVVAFEDVRDKLAAGINVDQLLLLLAVAYVVGLLVDAIGLVFDRCFIEKIDESPSRAACDAFYVKASSHLLAYRDSIWAYYFCYRNLMCLLLPGAVLWGLSLNARYGADALGVVITIALVAGRILFIAARELLKLYNEITASQTS